MFFVISKQSFSSGFHPRSSTLLRAVPRALRMTPSARGPEIRRRSPSLRGLRPAAGPEKVHRRPDCFRLEHAVFATKLDVECYVSFNMFDTRNAEQLYWGALIHHATSQRCICCTPQIFSSRAKRCSSDSPDGVVYWSAGATFS